VSDPASSFRSDAAEFARAVALFQARRFQEAEGALRGILVATPAHIEALQLLAAVVGAQGRHEESLECLDRARALRAPGPAALHNRARALFSLGRRAEARAELENVLKLKPDMDSSWTLLGSVLGALGDIAAAEAAYRRALALRPENADALYNLGILLQQAQRLDEAIACYRKALKLNPAFAGAHNNLANALKVKGRIADALANYGTALREVARPADAIALLERALRLKPASAAILGNLGIAYYEVHRYADAEACARRALELVPDFQDARNTLGNALAGQGRNEEAIACYRQVIAEAPRNADAYSNLGLILQEKGDDEAAIASYRKALELRPAHPDAIINMGYLLAEQGGRREAMEFYRRALAADPAATLAAYNLAMAHLCEFEFAEGWKLHEARFHTRPPIARERAFAIPRFTAADWGKGLRLAIWGEQGIGDQILYSTMLPEVEQRGQDFTFETDARLIPAFRRAHPAWKVISPEESAGAFATCQRHISVATMAGLLRPNRATFERQPRALLAADPDRVRGFRGRLARPGARVVGMSWRSFQPSVRGYLQRKKSAPLASFMALSQRDDLRLVDLQYGDTAEERSQFAASGGRLERLEGLDLFNDIDGVLAAVEACDLVVTTSNVTAHFAGSLGKRTLLVYLRANQPFHYWTPDENGRSLWYPSIEIVTARDFGSWDKAFGRIDEILRA